MKLNGIYLGFLIAILLLTVSIFEDPKDYVDDSLTIEDKERIISNLLSK